MIGPLIDDRAATIHKESKCGVCWSTANAKTGYEAFRELVALDINGPTDSDTQFDFEIEVFIDGMQRRLDTAG